MPASLLHSFRWRLLLLVGALVVASQAATFAGALTLLERDVRAGTARELDAGAELVEGWLAQRATLLGNGADVLVGDFGFRTAIATGDRETIASSLENNAARIGADVAVLYAPSGEPLVASEGAVSSWGREPAPLASGDPDARDEALMTLGDTAWQNVVVPVKAPLTIGRLLFGFALDADVATDLASQAGMQVSIGTLGNGSWSHDVTVRDGRAPVRDAAALDALASSDEARLVELAGVPFMVRTVLPAPGGSVRVVLQRSLAEALAPYRALRARLVATTGAALLFGLLAAAWMAHGVSRPIARLTHAAGRVLEGSYDAPTGIRRSDEIGTLARTFDAMRAAVAERETRITHLASHDEATGLANRRVLLERLDAALSAVPTAAGTAAASGPALLLVGIDNLAPTVETLGDRVGDALVVELAARLRAHAGPDAALARTGDDAFALVTPDASPDAVDGAMSAVIDALTRPLPVGDAVLAPAVSVGAALAPGHGTEASDLLRRASIALADARERGRPAHVYEPGRDEQLRRQLSIVADLVRAVERDELVLHYQPKVRCRDGAATGVEALVRWIHPEHGFMPPDEFIRLAESSGNVSLLSDWVMDRAVRQAAEWRREGRELAVSVNLSALDLADPALVDRVAASLLRHGLPAGSLTLEITESAVVEDESLALGTLEALRALGARVSIDDFGTGQSSLAKLRDMPVDELKIDRAFVTDIVAGSPDAMICRAIVELAHGLGLDVVTEGVETAEELAVLTDLGTDAVQGYFHSKPLTAPALVDWLDARVAPVGLDELNRAA